jgi:hypothetical protein
MCAYSSWPLSPVQVTDPNGGQMHEAKAQHTGQFAFTTKIAGEYQACFSTHGAITHSCAEASGPLTAE